MENNTKLRILYLYQHLLQHTDPDHPESTVELMKMLKEQHDIKVSRNTISDDLTMLSNCDLQIEVIHSTQNKYYYDGQAFEDAEMKILIDAVSSSKFITERKSEQLINKLLTLVPPHTAMKLRRHIYASDRVKTDNERGYYIVDAINDAIDARRKISFLYTNYDMEKKRFVANDGQPYTVSPYTLIWDGDYYYLRGYCDERGAMRTFRLDRLLQAPKLLMDAAVPKPDNYSIADFSKSVFRMYNTDEPTEVTLLCKASMMKILIDNFGLDVDTIPVDEEHFEARVSVCTSPTFYRWVFGFGGAIQIAGPKQIQKDYIEMLENALTIQKNFQTE